MKIAITGHTKGIGKACFDLFNTDNNCIGFSRSNGFDISVNGVVEKIVQDSLDADVFINNAYFEFKQTEIFKHLFEQWQSLEDKTIININSRSKYGVGKNQFYASTKKDLANTSYQAMFNKKNCRVININPGYVETDMVKEHIGKFNMLTPSKVADTIKWCLDQPQDIEIGELSIWKTTLR
jgi:short-subunit dehydrogenase